jgi:hypothetical protein
MSDEQEALKVRCPLCRAPVGHRCINGAWEDYRDYGYGKEREPHPQRIEAAREVTP